MAVQQNWVIVVTLTILFGVGFWMIYKFYYKPSQQKEAEEA